MTDSDTEVAPNGLPVFNSEQAFQEYLEEQFEGNGFTAIKEVSPAHSNYRADLLLIHDEFGKIGLELKKLSGGTDAGRAHQQIVRQYAGKSTLTTESTCGHLHLICRNYRKTR